MATTTNAELDALGLGSVSPKNVKGGPKIPFSLPTEEEIKALADRLKTATGIPYKDPGVKVVAYDSDDHGPWIAPVIGVTMISLVHIVCVLILMGFGLENWLILNGAAGFVTSFAIASLQHRFWRTTDAQIADAFNDKIFGGIVAVRSGFHWTHFWWSYFESVDFRNDELPVCGMKEKGTEARFSTRDPYKCTAEWESVLKPIDSVAGIKQWFRYKKEIRVSRIISVVNSRIASAGGRNVYTEILSHQDEFATWVEHIFGGEGVATEFEQELASTIANIAVKTVELTEDSAREIAESATKIRALEEAIPGLIAAGLHGKQASDVAALALDIMEKSVIAFEGVNNARFLAVGTNVAGIANMADDGGNGKRGKRGKKGGDK